MLDAIPPARHSAVRTALQAAFGTEVPDAPPVRMTGGMSGAALYRIRVGGIAYILRLEPEGAGPFNEPARSHLCMRRAAEACLAPTVRFSDAETGVVVMDLIVEQPLTQYAGDRSGMLTELAQSVRLLHETSPFPPVLDYLQGMDLLVGWFRKAGLSSPEAEELIDRFGAFRERYRTPPEDLVSSHNDLNAKNVLYDGRRLWLIDWDAAFLADRYVDLAAAANWFTQHDDEADVILATYLRADPTPAQRARLYLMRQVNLMFYGVMLAISAVGGARRQVDLGGARPASEMRAALGAGTLDLWRVENRLAYGSALLAQALEGFRGAQFERELKLAA